MIENAPVDISDPTESVRRDAARLTVLHETQLLDSEVEESFDRLTRLAVRLVGIPAAFISLVDENRDFYKSSCGFDEPLASARELQGPTFCHFTVSSTGPLVIPDTNADPLYRDVPTVRTLGVAAYVGIPLVISGQTIGAFCATDVTPRNWTTRDVDTLSELAAIATSEIELRSLGRRSDALRTEAEQSRAAAETARTTMSDLFRQAPAFIAVVRGTDHVFELANDRYYDLVGGQDVIGKRVIDAIPEVAGQGFIELLDNVLKTGESFIGTELPVRLSRSSDPEDLRYVTFVYQATSDSDGTRTGVFVHGVDVTDQVLARHELEALNERLRKQAAQLEMQSEELQTTTENLQVSTEELRERTAVAESARLQSERAAAALASSEGRYRTLSEAVPVQVWTGRTGCSTSSVRRGPRTSERRPMKRSEPVGPNSFTRMIFQVRLRYGRPRLEMELHTRRNSGFVTGRPGNIGGTSHAHCPTGYPMARSTGGSGPTRMWKESAARGPMQKPPTVPRANSSPS